MKLAPADAEELARAGRRRRYKRGQRVLFEGHRAGQVLVIHAGRVKVTTSTPQGDEIVLAVRGPGDLIGDQSALVGGGAGASVVALEDLDLTQLSGDAFVDFLRARPELLLAQLRRLIRVVRESDTKLLELATLSVEQRVARRLLDLVGDEAPASGGPIEISTPMSQEELAGLCGASREAVSRVLRTLRDAGVVETARRRLRILDLDALAAWSVAGASGP